MNYRKINNATGWAVFGIASIVYIMTMEKSGSLWDCGEFASCCHQLGIPHPPGAPLFILIGRIFSLIGQPLGLGPVGGINLMSALASSFTILFLFWTITHFARKILMQKSEEDAGKHTPAIMIAGIVGALAYTFSDSFWFSAVEAEVYAMSSLCTALVFWAILKWEDHPGNTSDPNNTAGRNQADKWLILIFFLMGLSIGVHLLNLLTIPAIVLVYYFKRYKFTPVGLLLALGVSVLMLGFVQKVIGQFSVSIGFFFDKLFVNGFSLPPFSGYVFFYILLGGLIWLGVRFAEKNGYNLLRIGLWCFAFTIIGMSTYWTTMIRSRANPGIDMYNVDNAYTLKGYLAREQYGDFPLLKGQHYEAEPYDSRVTGTKYVLRKDESGKLRYIVAGKDRENVYNEEDQMIFPRMWDNNDPNHQEFYRIWLGKEKGEKPTAKDNFSWFINYQVNWMYLRYFFWNFVGKQNDIQGLSSKRDGNWLTGIPFLDKLRLGDQSMMPDSLKNNKANNKLFALPLILGLIGFFFHLIRHRKDWLVTVLLFTMTGLAIVFYLNQAGPQPRERDYAYVGSFYAFAIWIGLGVLQVRDWFGRFLKGNTSLYAAGALCTLAVPVLMASQEWDDHDRGKKTLARDLAIDYLESCPQNAMLFTIGDNDTYPLWYAQEVEGIRTDVRVVNTSLLGIDWYLDQLQYEVNKSPAFKMIWKSSDYEGSNLDILVERQYENISTDTRFPLDTMLMIAAKMRDNTVDRGPDFYPGKNVFVRTDMTKAAQLYKLSPGDSLLPQMYFTISQGRGYLTKGDFGILNVIAGNLNSRPICFTGENREVKSLGLSNYLRREGMVYRLIPARLVKGTETDEATVKMNSIFKFGNAKTKGVYYDEENRRHLESIRDTYIEVAEELVNDAEAFKRNGNTAEADKKLQQARGLLQKVDTELPTYSLPYGMPSRGGFNNGSSLRMSEVAFRANDSALARRILDEVETDTWQEMRFYYSLSNPGVKPTKKNVDDFIADYMLLMKPAPASQNKILEEKAANIFKNKYSGFTVQGGHEAIRNYMEARDLRSRYLEAPQPVMPQMPGETTPPPVQNPVTPVKTDTQKKPG